MSPLYIYVDHNDTIFDRKTQTYDIPVLEKLSAFKQEGNIIILATDSDREAAREYKKALAAIHYGNLFDKTVTMEDHYIGKSQEKFWDFQADVQKISKKRMLLVDNDLGNVRIALRSHVLAVYADAHLETNLGHAYHAMRSKLD